MLDDLSVERVAECHEKLRFADPALPNPGHPKSSRSASSAAR